MGGKIERVHLVFEGHVRGPFLEFPPFTFFCEGCLLVAIFNPRNVKFGLRPVI
jgi:hypothetical protein